MEGSVRRAGDRIRISAQVIDGSSGNHIWARRYDRDVADIFDIQDEITQAIVTEIEPELGKAERERARLKPPETLDAWEIYQRGLWQMYRRTPDDMEEALTLMRRAVEFDPMFGPAYSGIAFCQFYRVIWGMAEPKGREADEGLEAARKAVALDPDDSEARARLGNMHIARRENAEAADILRTAIEMRPTNGQAHLFLGSALAWGGRSAEAIPVLQQALHLSPSDPIVGPCMARLADAYLFQGEYAQALEWARKAVREPGTQFWVPAILASVLGHLGREDEARVAREQLLSRKPEFSIEFVSQASPITDVADLEVYIDGLRKAGLPE